VASLAAEDEDTSTVATAKVEAAWEYREEGMVIAALPAAVLEVLRTEAGEVAWMGAVGLPAWVA